MSKPHRKVQVWIVCARPGSRAGRFQVLLLKMRKDRGGYWQPVPGSGEKGEGLKAAALREAVEETGLRFRMQPRSLAESFRFESRWGGTCEEHGFFLRVAAGRDGEPVQVVLDPGEHTDYEWVSPSV